MAKKRTRIPKRRKQSRAVDAAGLLQTPPAWFDDAGLHALLPGPKPAPHELEAATKRYQENIRKSPLWAQMVAEFGSVKAEELLRQFRVELR